MIGFIPDYEAEATMNIAKVMKMTAKTMVSLNKVFSIPRRVR